MEYDMIIIKPSLDDALVHFGVKGMKWGIRKKRPIGLGRRAQRRVNTEYQVKKKSKGYSEKTYQKFKKKGMTHAQAVEAAKKSRKKKIAAIAIGAAAVGLTALAIYRKKNGMGKNANQIQIFENQLKQREADRQAAMNNYKFKSLKEYEAAKESLKGQIQRQYDAGLRNKNEVTDNELRRYGKRLSELNKASRSLVNRRAKLNKAISSFNKAGYR